VEVDFGDEVNDIRGSVVVIQAATTAPEPATYLLVSAGLLLVFVGRRGKGQTGSDL
jgi:hypothetical protein